MLNAAEAQLRLRRAFRRGYFMFLAVLLALLAILASAVLSGALADLLNTLLGKSSLLMIAATALGLSVPLFLAVWSLIGSAVLGFGFREPPIMEGVRD